MKKGSQLTRLFSTEMMKLRTNGTIYLLRKRYSGTQACRQGLKEKPLGYEKLSFLFVMLFFGCIMSILVVLFEYIIQTKNKDYEITRKGKEVEEMIGEILEVQGLPNQETQNILARLFQKYFRQSKDEANFNFELDSKKFPSKIPRPITRKNCV